MIRAILAIYFIHTVIENIKSGLKNKQFKNDVKTALSAILKKLQHF